MESGFMDGLRVLGFDLETTGLDTRRDRIVQYALVGSDHQGDVITLDKITTKGPGTGINPMKIDSLIQMISNLIILKIPHQIWLMVSGILIWLIVQGKLRDLIS